MLSLNSIVQENLPFRQEERLVNGLKGYCSKLGFSSLETNRIIVWTLRLLRFHNDQHPSDLSLQDIRTFIAFLAEEHSYSQTIQVNAINAIMFLFNEFLKIPMPFIEPFPGNKRRGYAERFGETNCRNVICHLKATTLLISKLTLLTNSTLKDIFNLRLSDIDLKKNQITIRNRDNSVKYLVKIPIQLILDLRIQLMRSKQLIRSNKNLFAVRLNTDNLVKKHNTKLKNRDNFISSGYLFYLQKHDLLGNDSRSNQFQLLKSDIRFAIRKQFRQSNLKNLSLTRINSNLNSLEYKSRNMQKTHCKQSSFNFSNGLNFSINYYYTNYKLYARYKALTEAGMESNLSS